jgi:hypothetical protein
VTETNVFKKICMFMPTEDGLRACVRACVPNLKFPMKAHRPAWFKATVLDQDTNSLTISMTRVA